MKRKKILVISVGIWPPAVEMAGTAAIYHLLKLLAKEDIFEIHVLTALPSWASPDVEQWVRRQKKEHNLTLHFVKANNLFLTRFLFFLEAIKLQRQFKFDLIHDYSSSPLLIGLTGILGKICRSKTLHTLCVVNEGLLGSRKLAFGFSWVDRIICTGPNLSPSKKGVKYLPFGIDTAKFKPRPKGFESLPAGQAGTVLFLGSLDERKGARISMRAAREVVGKHPDAKFILASYGKEGRDPDYSLNRRKLEELSLGFKKNVEFLEGLQDVPQLMSDADIFILPATSLHGTLTPPLTLIEAMGSGKPCVVSDVCRGDGLVEDKVNCLLFRSGDVGDLADKLNLLLNDALLREELGRKARQKVADQFEINKIASRLRAIYATT